MRKSEILSIRREDIDLQRRVIFIPKAKAGAREQPITDHLGEFLASVRGRAATGQPVVVPVTRREGRAHRRRAQAIPVKRISGHKTLAMVERYSHQNGTHIQAAMDKLQARFKLAS